MIAPILMQQDVTHIQRIAAPEAHLDNPREAVYDVTMLPHVEEQIHEQKDAAEGPCDDNANCIYQVQLCTLPLCLVQQPPQAYQRRSDLC